MRLPLGILSVGIITLSMGLDDAQAQMVQVRPGYVRAPFVRVYRDPFGGTHVRAPFVDVYRPGFSRRRVYAPGEVIGGPDAGYRGTVPYSVQTDEMIPLEGTARQQLYAAAAALDRSLGRFETAASWRRYFALDAGSVLSREQGFADDRQSLPALSAMLQRFDSVNQSAEFQMIAALPAFRQAHDRLALYLAEAAENDESARSLEAEELPAPPPTR